MLLNGVSMDWKVILKAAPNRDKFMMMLAHSKDAVRSEDAVLSRLGADIDALKAVVKNLQDMLLKYFDF